MNQDIKFAVLPVQPLQANCTVFVDQNTGQGAVVDPGGDVERILSVFEELGGKELISIYCTHGHADHILAVDQLKEESGAKVYFPEKDMYLWEMLPEQCSMIGLPYTGQLSTPDLLIDETHRTIPGSAEVIHTPGHSLGSVCYYFREEKVLIAGDLLFQRSIGRTDLPGGNSDQILASIKEKVFTLDPEVTVITGHGPTTTIGEEIRENPFLQ
jgi:hydroxyacylglutathione hydrolase